MDLAGPFKEKTLGGHQYAVIMVDHFSRYVFVDFIASKSARNVLSSYRRFCAHTQTRPQHVHSDGGTEFQGVFSQFLRDSMIRQTYSCPYSAFQNSIAERRVRSCKEIARRNMLESGFPPQFYARAMHTGVVQMNQHPVIDDPLHSRTTPFAVMFPNRKPRPLRVFGSVAYSLILPKAARKDNLRYPGKVGWFIGYSDYSDDLMVCDPKTRTVSGRRDVLFDESWRYSPRRPDNSSMAGSHDGDEHANSSPPAEHQPQRKSGQNQGGQSTSTQGRMQAGSQASSNQGGPQTSGNQGGPQTSASPPEDSVPHEPHAPDPDLQEDGEVHTHPHQVHADPLQHEPDLGGPLPTDMSITFHINLAVGTGSHVRSKLARDPNARVLGIDIRRDWGHKVLNYIPSEHHSRFTYQHLDLSDLTYSKLGKLVQDTWGIRLKQLATVHYSPPCETYSSAHHGHSPHRNGRHPKPGPEGLKARQHDALNGSMFETLAELARKTNRTIISIEQPVSDFRWMPFTRKLLRNEGWFAREASHCSNRYDHEQIYPRKNTHWFLYNVRPDVPLKQCTNQCGDCLVSGTGYHKLLVCYRPDMQTGQEVMPDDKMLKGMIPTKIFDVIEDHNGDPSFHKVAHYLCCL